MSPWLVEMIGAAAAIIGTLCWLPQTIHTIRTKNTKSLSLSTNLLFLLALMLWLVYGLAIQSWPLIGANLVSFCLIATIVALKLRHG